MQKYVYVISLVGAGIIVLLCYLLAVSHNQNKRLKNQVHKLEVTIAQQSQAQAMVIASAGPGAATSPTDQKIKDLSTRFVGDPRSIAEKLRDFMLENPHDFALVCKVIADLAENHEALPDQDLRWLYQTQTNLDLQRVIAQMASFRGDNHLLDAYLTQLQPGLESPSVDERRNTLGRLAKTRYTGAATFILPLLKESDASIVLDALLALRVTGNETHLKALDSLRKHRDESIGWLVKDVTSNLEILSAKARNHITQNDIALELPPITIH